MARSGPGWLALVLVAAAVVARAASSGWSAAATDERAWPESDFQILWSAGRALAEGRDPSDPAVLDEIGRRAGRASTPFAAALPLVARSAGALSDEFEPAFRAALVGQALLVLATLALLTRLVVAEGLAPVPAVAVALGSLGLNDGLWMSLAMNSTNLLALAALCGAALAATRRRAGAEGAALALATLAKLSPALVVLAAWLAGRRRAALTWAAVLAGAAALSFLWLGVGPQVGWVQRTLPALGYAPDLPPGHFDNSTHAWNLSPHGLLARAGAQGDLPPVLVLAGALAVAGLVLWQLALLARARRSPGDATTLAAAAVTASLLVSSVTWPHHLVLLALPVALLAARLPRAPAPALAGLVATALLMAPLGILGGDSTLALEGPLRTAACVIVFAALVALPARPWTPEAGPPAAPGPPGALR